MVQACDDRQVKSLLLRSCLMFLLVVDKKTVKTERKTISHAFAHILHFKSFWFGHVARCTMSCLKMCSITSIAEKASKVQSGCSYGKETIASGLYGARQFTLSKPLHDLMLSIVYYRV